MTERKLKRNQDGFAVVRNDSDGVLRYVYSNGEIDEKSRVEKRAPHELEVQHMAEMILPKPEYI